MSWLSLIVLVNQLIVPSFFRWLVILNEKKGVFLNILTFQNPLKTFKIKKKFSVILGDLEGAECRHNEQPITTHY